MPEKPRIAIITPSLEPVASVMYPVTLFQELKKQGYPCDLYFLKNSSMQAYCPGAQKIALSQNIPWQQYDILNTHGFIADIYGLLHRPLFSKTKHISTLHGFFFFHFKEKFPVFLAAFISLTWMLLLKRADRYVVLTEYAQSRYPLLSKKKMRTVKSGIKPFQAADIDPSDAETFTEIKATGKIVLGSVCRIILSKGLEQVIKILPQNADLHFVIVGDGPQKIELKKMAQQLKVENQVTFLGYRSDGRRYLPHFDVFMMPSREETFGLTLLESAQLSVPIVCSSIPTFREIFSAKEVSFFNLNDENSLRSAIDEAVKTRSKKTVAAKDRFLEEYTVAKMTQQYAKLFKE